MTGHEIMKQLDPLEFPTMSKHSALKEKKKKRELLIGLSEAFSLNFLSVRDYYYVTN